MISGFEAHFGPRLEEDINPSPAVSVVFAETTEEKDFSMAARIKAAQEPDVTELVQVKVLGNYRVLHDGKPYVGGDVVEIPADKAKSWVGQRWVELVKEEK